MSTAHEPRASRWSGVFARLYDPVLALGEQRGMAARRRTLLRGARGRVLELGAGTGRNLAAYGDDVEQLVLTEPDLGMLGILRRRVAAADRAAEVVAASAEALPFPDASFDTVVSTLVLCTVENPEATLREVRRVLRPDGVLLFIEHVRAERRALARWQDLLAGPWRAFAVGCNCNRPTLPLLHEHFTVGDVERAAWRGMPRIVRPLVLGRAGA